MKLTIRSFFFLVFILVFSSGQSEDIKFISYTVDNGACQALTYMTGSRLEIPEDAFVNPNNLPVKIKYRELHDKADILLSGVSMKMKGGGVLETGGMFEIYASIDGEPAKLKKGKKISVDLAGLNKTPDLLTYKYDGIKKEWVGINIPMTEKKALGDDDNSELWGSSFPSPMEMEDEWSGFIEDDDWCCDEKDAASDDWNRKFAARQELKFEVFRSMEIEDFGMYNYDRLLKEENAVRIMANVEYSMEPGKEFTGSVFVVYEGIQSVIEFSAYTLKNEFRLLSDTPYKMFTILSDGNIAALAKEALPPSKIAAVKDKEFKFVLVPQKIKGNNKEDLNQFLAFNN